MGFGRPRHWGTIGSVVGIPPTFHFKLSVYHIHYTHAIPFSTHENNLIVWGVCIEAAHGVGTTADHTAQLFLHCLAHTATAEQSRLPLRRLNCPLALSYLGLMSEPSWSALERGNPPPRRKACSACIKAKRRCTLGSPACLRCIQRKIECNYPDASKHRPIRGSNHAPDPSDAVDFSVPLEILPRETGSLTPPSWGSTSCTLTTPPVFASDQEDLEAQTRETSAAISGLSPNDAIQDVISGVIEARLRYAIKELRAAVTQMALEYATPWSHPRLYEHAMPRTMQGG